MTDENTVFVAERVGGLDDEQPADIGLPPARRYTHVIKALYERPWAIQPNTLNMMAEVLRLRLSGVSFTEDELALRLAEGREGLGDRFVEAGGVVVGNVAVIPMYGILSQRFSLMAQMSSGGVSLDELRGALADALNNPDVKAVVFDIDSPGGSVDGIPEFAAELRRLSQGPKPIVGQVNTLAASAAYWLASNMTEIAITPSGEAGSIGVYAVHEDYSKADEMAGVKTTLVSAGPYKVEGNPHEPLGDEARASIQEHVDAFYSQFLSDVAKGRGRSVQAVADDFGGGRTLLAQKALEAGMVDRVATLDETVQALQKRRPALSPASGRRAEDEPNVYAADPAVAAKTFASMSDLIAAFEAEDAAAETPAVRPDPDWNKRMSATTKPKRRKGLFRCPN